MFLDKWYLDAVFHDGTVWFGYRASLQFWKFPPLFWASECQVSPGGKEEKVSCWKKLAPPRLENGEWQWDGPDGFHAGWRSSGSGFERELASESRFRVRWNCIAPRAIVTRTAENGRPANTVGTGYVEHLQMELTRTGLPFRDLCWGRAHAEDSSLTWIRWGRGRDFSLVLEDGAPVSGKFQTLPDGELRVHTGRGRWETANGRKLCDRDVRRSFPRGLVWLTGKIAPVKELKMCGPVRHCTNAGESTGTGIWEEVRWL